MIENLLDHSVSLASLESRALLTLPSPLSLDRLKNGLQDIFVGQSMMTNLFNILLLLNLKDSAINHLNAKDLMSLRDLYINVECTDVRRYSTVLNKKRMIQSSIILHVCHITSTKTNKIK